MAEEELTKDNIIEEKPITILKTKEELIFNIKEWIKIENEIKSLTKEIKDKRTKMKNLTSNLVNTMKANSIDCFDINGGALIYKKKTTKKTISGKFLLEQLEEYFKDNQEMAQDLHKKLWDSRVVVTKEEIKREQNKVK